MPIKTILHLDDHPLFTKGVKELLCKQMDVEYFSYQSPNSALREVKQRLKNKSTINLIITDYNHLGITGYQFARAIRRFEKTCSMKIPIMLLSMTTENYCEIRLGIHNGTLDAYLSKACDPYVFLGGDTQYHSLKT